MASQTKVWWETRKNLSPPDVWDLRYSFSFRGCFSRTHIPFLLITPLHDENSDDRRSCLFLASLCLDRDVSGWVYQSDRQRYAYRFVGRIGVKRYINARPEYIMGEGFDSDPETDLLRPLSH